jgi:hypothetical protein
MRKYWIQRICLLFAVSTAAMNAQSTFVTVLGTVKEPTGAVVPNAQIRITNQGTSVSKSTLTDQTGSYQFVNMDVGTYQVSVEAVGFQKIEFSAFQLGAR